MSSKQYHLRERYHGKIRNNFYFRLSNFKNGYQLIDRPKREFFFDELKSFSSVIRLVVSYGYVLDDSVEILISFELSV